MSAILTLPYPCSSHPPSQLKLFFPESPPSASMSSFHVQPTHLIKEWVEGYLLDYRKLTSGYATKENETPSPRNH